MGRLVQLLRPTLNPQASLICPDPRHVAAQHDVGAWIVFGDLLAARMHEAHRRNVRARARARHTPVEAVIGVARTEHAAARGPRQPVGAVMAQIERAPQIEIAARIPGQRLARRGGILIEHVRRPVALARRRRRAPQPSIVRDGGRGKPARAVIAMIEADAGAGEGVRQRIEIVVDLPGISDGGDGRALRRAERRLCAPRASVVGIARQSRDAAQGAAAHFAQTVQRIVEIFRAPSIRPHDGGAVGALINYKVTSPAALPFPA